MSVQQEVKVGYLYSWCIKRNNKPPTYIYSMFSKHKNIVVKVKNRLLYEINIHWICKVEIQDFTYIGIGVGQNSPEAQMNAELQFCRYLVASNLMSKLEIFTHYYGVFANDESIKNYNCTYCEPIFPLNLIGDRLMLRLMHHRKEFRFSSTDVNITIRLLFDDQYIFTIHVKEQIEVFSDNYSGIGLADKLCYGKVNALFDLCDKLAVDPNSVIAQDDFFRSENIYFPTEQNLKTYKEAVGEKSFKEIPLQIESLKISSIIYPLQTSSIRLENASSNPNNSSKDATNRKYTTSKNASLLHMILDQTIPKEPKSFGSTDDSKIFKGIATSSGLAENKNATNEAFQKLVLTESHSMTSSIKQQSSHEQEQLRVDDKNNKSAKRKNSTTCVKDKKEEEKPQTKKTSLYSTDDIEMSELSKINNNSPKSANESCPTAFNTQSRVIVQKGSSGSNNIMHPKNITSCVKIKKDEDEIVTKPSSYVSTDNSRRPEILKIDINSPKFCNTKNFTYQNLTKLVLSESLPISSNTQSSFSPIQHQLPRSNDNISSQIISKLELFANQNLRESALNESCSIASINKPTSSPIQESNDNRPKYIKARKSLPLTSSTQPSSSNIQRHILKDELSAKNTLYTNFATSDGTRHAEFSRIDALNPTHDNNSNLLTNQISGKPDLNESNPVVFYTIPPNSPTQHQISSIEDEEVNRFIIKNINIMNRYSIDSIGENTLTNVAAMKQFLAECALYTKLYKTLLTNLCARNYYQDYTDNQESSNLPTSPYTDNAYVNSNLKRKSNSSALICNNSECIESPKKAKNLNLYSTNSTDLVSHAVVSNEDNDNPSQSLIYSGKDNKQPALNETSEPTNDFQMCEERFSMNPLDQTNQECERFIDEGRTSSTDSSSINVDD